jgi:hypothetical protein
MALLSYQKDKYRYEEEFEDKFSSLLLSQKILLAAFKKRKYAKGDLDLADKEFHEAIDFVNSNEREKPNKLATK